jgi:hypothetical protein
MAVTALIQFNQGGPGTAGQAFEGTIAGGLVTVTNDDDTGVSTFTFTMLDVPPTSAVPTGVMTTGAPPSSATFTPDVPGTYRVQLEVTDGTPDVDIRCFGVRNARGVIVPPYQRNPDPKPLPGSGYPGEKPDEQNYGAQARGWSGDTASGQLEQFFNTYDDVAPLTLTSTPFTATATNEEPLYVVDLATIGSNAVFNMPASGWRVGQKFRVRTTGNTVYHVTVNMPGGHTLDGESSLALADGEGAVFIYIGSSKWVVIPGSRIPNRTDNILTSQVFS